MSRNCQDNESKNSQKCTIKTDNAFHRLFLPPMPNHLTIIMLPNASIYARKCQGKCSWNACLNETSIQLDASWAAASPACCAALASSPEGIPAIAVNVDKTKRNAIMDRNTPTVMPATGLFS